MKNLSTLIIFTAILIGASSLDLFAQKKARKTSSARAYYSHTLDRPKYKMKKKKMYKYTRSKYNRGAKADVRNAKMRRKGLFGSTTRS